MLMVNTDVNITHLSIQKLMTALNIDKYGGQGKYENREHREIMVRYPLMQPGVSNELEQKYMVARHP